MHGRETDEVFSPKPTVTLSGSENTEDIGMNLGAGRNAVERICGFCIGDLRLAVLRIRESPREVGSEGFHAGDTVRASATRKGLIVAAEVVTHNPGSGQGLVFSFIGNIKRGSSVCVRDLRDALHLKLGARAAAFMAPAPNKHKRCLQRCVAHLQGPHSHGYEAQAVLGAACVF